MAEVVGSIQPTHHEVVAIGQVQTHLVTMHRESYQLQPRRPARAHTGPRQDISVGTRRGLAQHAAFLEAHRDSRAHDLQHAVHVAIRNHGPGRNHDSTRFANHRIVVLEHDPRQVLAGRARHPDG